MVGRAGCPGVHRGSRGPDPSGVGDGALDRRPPLRPDDACGDMAVSEEEEGAGCGCSTRRAPLPSLMFAALLAPLALLTTSPPALSPGGAGEPVGSVSSRSALEARALLHRRPRRRVEVGFGAVRDAWPAEYRQCRARIIVDVGRRWSTLVPIPVKVSRTIRRRARRILTGGAVAGVRGGAIVVNGGNFRQGTAYGRQITKIEAT